MVADMRGVAAVVVEMAAVTPGPRLHLARWLQHRQHAKPRHRPARPVALTTWMTTFPSDQKFFDL